MSESTIEPLRVSFSIPLPRLACSGHFVSNIGSHDRGQALINSKLRDITNNGKFRTHWFRRLVSNPH